MICFIKYDNFLKTLSIDKEVTYEIDGQEIILTCINHTLYCRYNQNIEIQVNKGESKQLVINNKPVVIKNLLFDKGYNIYQYYVNKKTISIGNLIDADIYIQGSGIQDIYAYIDTSQGTIKPVYKNVYVQDQLTDKETYAMNKNIKIENMCLVLSKQFLMVNTCDNLNVNLKLFDKKPLQSYAYLKREDVSINYLSTNQIDLKPLELDKTPKLNKNKSSLLISIGPMLMMSSASIFVGIINGYNAYSQGRELIEIMPMLVLPCVMLISCLLWNPLQRYTSNKSDKKQYEEALASYYTDCRNLIDDYSSLKAKNNTLIKNAYLLPTQIDQIDNINKLLFSKHKDSQGFFKLLLGEYEQKEYIAHHDDIYVDGLLEKARTSSNAPLVLDLNEYKRVGVVGDQGLLFFEYLLAQLVIYSDEKQFKLVIFANNQYLNDNYLIRLLPHLMLGCLLIATNEDEAQKVINTLKNNNLLVVCFTNNEKLANYINADEWYVIASNESVKNISIEALIKLEGFIGHLSTNKQALTFKNKELCRIDMNKLAFKLYNYAKHRLLLNNKSLDILSLNNADKILKNWTNNDYGKQLKIPLGLNQEGLVINLDISSNANGPHGIIAGTTGSGKSEFILSLILSLCMNYSPNLLQIAIIDFKGEDLLSKCTYKGQRVPHIVQSLSNLNDDDIDRALASLLSECQYRQQLFLEVASQYNAPINSLDDYVLLRKDHQEIKSLAHLLVIVDEFAEVKKAIPQFMEEIMSVARIGRSLGLHLLLATQRPQGVINEQVLSNIHYRICLKTEDKQDSKDLLNSDIASTFNNPGRFALRCDSQLSVAQASYAQELIDDDSCKVMLLDNQGEVYKKTKSHHTIQQNEYLIETLNDTNYKWQSRKLWLDPIVSVNNVINKKDSLYLGKIDNYHQRKYDDYWLSINDHLLIYDNNSSNTDQILMNFIYQLNNEVISDTQVIILTINPEAYMPCKKFRHVLDVIDYEDTYSLNRVLSYIEDNHQRNIYLIFDKLLNFIKQGTDNKTYLSKLVDIASYHQTRLIVLFNNMNQLPLNLQNNSIKLLIGQINDDVTISFFMRKTKLKTLANNQALVFKDNNLNKLTLYLENTTTNLKENIEESYDMALSIPTLIKSIDYGNDVIGLDIESGKTIKIKDNLVVVSHFQEYLDFFKERFNKQANIIYKLASEYRQNGYAQQVLWLGPGYNDQYVLKSRFTKCNDDEGIIHFMYKAKKVRLIEGSYPCFD